MNNDMMLGFKEYKNTPGFTLESLYEILQNAPVSFGKPVMGMMQKTEAIIYPIEKGRMDIYVYLHKDKIIVNRAFKQKSGMGKEMAKEVALTAIFDGNDANDTQLADMYVEEMDGIMKQVMAGKTEIESVTASAEGGESLDFFMKQKITLIKDKYSIYGSDEKECYFVKGNITGLSFSIQDSFGAELFTVKKKMVAITPEYTLMQGKRNIGHIKKTLSLLKEEIKGNINGEELLIKGNISGYAFTIFLNDKIVGSVNATRFSIGDCYNIKVMDPSKKDIVIAIAVICDNSVKNKDS